MRTVIARRCMASHLPCFHPSKNKIREADNGVTIIAKCKQPTRKPLPHLTSFPRWGEPCITVSMLWPKYVSNSSLLVHFFQAAPWWCLKVAVLLEVLLADMISFSAPTYSLSFSWIKLLKKSCGSHYACFAQRHTAWPIPCPYRLDIITQAFMHCDLSCNWLLWLAFRKNCIPGYYAKTHATIAKHARAQDSREIVPSGVLSCVSRFDCQWNVVPTMG